MTFEDLACYAVRHQNAKFCFSIQLHHQAQHGLARPPQGLRVDPCSACKAATSLVLLVCHPLNWRAAAPAAACWCTPNPSKPGASRNTCYLSSSVHPPIRCTCCCCSRTSAARWARGRVERNSEIGPNGQNLASAILGGRVAVPPGPLRLPGGVALNRSSPAAPQTW